MYFIIQFADLLYHYLPKGLPLPPGFVTLDGSPV
jgi:hypothetical protein